MLASVLAWTQRLSIIGDSKPDEEEPLKAAIIL
jgi:hypothetical protein